MELDELRRQWQQPESAIPPVYAATELRELLVRRQSNLVEQMRRNTWWEAGIGLGLIAPALIWDAFTGRKSLDFFFAVAMCLITLVMVFYYYRVLAVLRQMAQTSGSVRGHLERLCGGLRQLLRFYYRFTLAVGPLMFVLLYGFKVMQELARPGGVRPSRLVAIGVLLAFFGGALQLGIVYLTRWWIQRLYGRHLDHLETQLRELNE